MNCKDDADRGRYATAHDTYLFNQPEKLLAPRKEGAQ